MKAFESWNPALSRMELRFKVMYGNMFFINILIYSKVSIIKLSPPSAQESSFDVICKLHCSNHWCHAIENIGIQRTRAFRFIYVINARLMWHIRVRAETEMGGHKESY